MSYEVHSIHINVGQGDSAIHLLVQPVPGEPGRYKVEGACLIDGGDKGNGNRIKDAIAYIKHKYDVGNYEVVGTDKMCFDSVVITHWDMDHYTGIEELIEAEYDEIVRVPKTEAEWESAKSKLENATISLFRYNKGRDKKSGLLTTLYAPYWNDVNCEDIYPPITGKPKKKADIPVSWSDGGKAPITTFNIRYEFDIQVEKPDGKKGTDRRPLDLKGLCNLCYKPEEMIGTNFLDNKGLKAGNTYDKVENKGDLASKTSSPLPVGIFCIVSRAHVIGRSGIVTEMLRESVVRRRPVLLLSSLN